MLKIMYYYIKENTVYYMIAAVLFFLLFVFSGIYMDELVVSRTELSYVDSLSDSLSIYPPDTNIGQEQERLYQNKHIGYARLQTVENNDMGNSNACLAVDFFVSRQLFFGIKGRELSFSNGENEVILYGENLRKTYKIGEMVSLNGVEYTVVGYLPSYEPIWDMFYFQNAVNDTSQNNDTAIGSMNEAAVRKSETNVDMENMLTYAKNQNMYIINNENAFHSEEKIVKSCVFTDGDIIKGKTAVCMENTKKELRKCLKEKLIFESVSILMLMGLAVYLCVAVSVIQHKKCVEMYAVFQLCGMQPAKYNIICTLLSFLVIAVSYFLYLMIYWIVVHREHFDGRLETGRLYFTGAVALVLIAILFLLNSVTNRKSALEVLRESE